MTENFPGPMAGNTALVTGGPGGIGRATAAVLDRAGTGDVTAHRSRCSPAPPARR